MIKSEEIDKQKNRKETDMTKKKVIRLPERKYITEYLRRATDLEYDRYSMGKILEKLKNSFDVNKSVIEAKEGEIAWLDTSVKEMQQSLNVNMHPVNVGDVISKTIIVAIIVFGILIMESILGFGILTILIEIVGTMLNGSMGLLFLIFLVALPLLISFLYCSAVADVKNTADRIVKQRKIEDLCSKVKEAREAARRCRVRGVLLEKEIGRCVVQYSSLNRIRREFYSGGLIPEKYQDVVPMSTMYEYFTTRICTKLDGYEGAFARFEYQVRLDQIASSVDQISRKMDTVIRHQGQILRKVEEIDHHIDDVIDKVEENGNRLSQMRQSMESMRGSLDRIEENAELTKYYSEVTARFAQYKMWKEGYTYHRYL